MEKYAHWLSCVTALISLYAQGVDWYFAYIVDLTG